MQLKQMLSYLVILTLSLASCTSPKQEGRFIEVIGEAFEQLPTDGLLRANVYFNGNEEQAKTFREWFAYTEKKEVQLQSENIYYNFYPDQPNLQGFNLNLSYWVTFTNRTDYESFKSSMMENKIPASINLLFDAYGNQPRNQEAVLLQSAIDDAILKIKELTGIDEPFIISISQVPLETYQEHYPEGNRRLQVLVRARLD
jgi:hypothetical protein